MAIYKLNRETKKESIEDRLQRAINLGREETLKEVLEWLNDNFFTGEQEISQYSIEVESILKSVFSSKEEMLQSFKERFNISEPGVYKVEVETLI